MFQHKTVRRVVDRQSIAVLSVSIALILLLFTDMTDFISFSVLGICLCLIGLAQKSMKIDPWILTALIVYIVLNYASSFTVYENTVFGNGSRQMVFIVIYGLLCSLDTRRDAFLKKLCCIIVFLLAFIGIVGFFIDSFFRIPSRLNFPLGNPNSAGIVFAIGWFALQGFKRDSGLDETAPDDSNDALKITFSKFNRALSQLLVMAEPWILVALVLTLSMGSMMSLLVGLIVFSLSKWVESKNQKVDSKAFLRDFLLPILSRMIFCLALGLLIYVSSDRTGFPVMTTCLMVYLIGISALWGRFDAFLKNHAWVCIIIVVVGLVCVAGAVILRPSSFATFAERIHMMQNGLGYMLKNPLFGIGMNQWRYQNLLDEDLYFNTRHIHNAFIHIGVEIGLIAMACLIVVAVRCFMGKAKPAQLGESAAFLVHMLIDTGFFLVGIVSLFIVTDGGANRRGKVIGSLGTRLLFALCGMMFMDNLVMYLVLAA